VDIRKIADHASNRYFARYAMAEMAELARRHGFKLAFVMDGVREAVYADRPAGAYEVGKLNEIASDLAGELKLPLLDLHRAFEADYRVSRRRFEFPFDWHWNVHGNEVAGTAITQFLLSEPGLLADRPTRPRAAALGTRR
jgi:hypothetical protein